MKRVCVVTSSLAIALLAAASPVGAGQAATPVPEIESVHMTVKVFAVAKGNSTDAVAAKRIRRGTRIRVTLSRPGTLQLLAQKRGQGRVARSGDCVRQTHSNRRRPDCTLLRTRMTLLRAAAVKGRNRFVFTGRAPGVVLKPGPYQFTITASNGVEESAERVVRFRIIPG